MSESRGVKLPIRLVPRRGQTLFQIAFSLAWCAFVIYWLVNFLDASTLDPQSLLSASWQLDDVLILCIPGLMLGLGIFNFLRNVFQLLPGSPFDHILLAREGFGHVRLGRQRMQRWSRIRRFIGLRKRFGKSLRWVLQVEGSESGETNQTLLSLTLDGYLPAFHGERDRDGVVAWLDSLPALTSDGMLPERIDVPELLIPSVYLVKSEPQSEATIVPASSRRKSVIER